MEKAAMAERRLRVFHTVARLLSFTQTAEMLGMTQPAVTAQIRALEQHFNTRLFDRSHNKVTLTEAGATVFEHVDKILNTYALMEGVVAQTTGETSGLVHIGASTTVADYVLPDLLGDFKRQWPNVEISLDVANSDEITERVIAATIDLGVVEGPITGDRTAVELMQVDHLVVVMNPEHALASMDFVEPGALVTEPFVGREPGSGTREVIAAYLKENGLDYDELRIYLELASPEAIKTAVEAQAGISIMSRSTVDKEVELGTLRAVALTPRLEREFSLVHPTGGPISEPARTILEFLRSSVAGTASTIESHWNAAQS